MKPRPYQEAAVDALFSYFLESMGHPIVAMPTGTGKSIVIAEFCRRALALYPFTRILVITHVKELIEQNHEKLLMVWPTAPSGVFSAGLRQKDTGRAITFCGIGSVVKNPRLFGHVDLIIIDECHTVSPKQDTSYRKFIAALQIVNPALKVIGLSATPYRLGQGELVEAEGLFTDVAFDLCAMEAFNKLVSDGYICPLIPKKMQAELDVSGVRMTGGDYNKKDLAAAVDREAVTRAALEEMIAHGQDRAHWLVFASGIPHTEHAATMLCEMGIEAVAVHSKSPAGLREDATEAFKAGEIRALINNGIFTTGFDFPGIDLISVLRPTQSPGLWVQMLGRGTRPVYAPGFDLGSVAGRLDAQRAGPKANCLVLDFAGNTKRLGPINDPRKPKKRGKAQAGDMPAKICPACDTFNHVSARFCTNCGQEFIAQVRITSGASEEELIAGLNQKPPEEPRTEWFAVENVTYSKHIPWNRRKNLKGYVPASLRVSYNCGIRSFTEHLCLEHGGSTAAGAGRVWRELGGTAIPKTVDEALTYTSSLPEPARLRVWVNRKHPRVMFRDYERNPHK